SRLTSAGQGVLPAQLPTDVTWFTGRESHLHRLDHLLSAAGDGIAPPVLAAVTGTAGGGETAPGVHPARRAPPPVPAGPRYVGPLLAGGGGGAAGPPVPPPVALARFLRALGAPPEHLPTDVDDAGGMYRSLLAGRRILVVLDNAHDPQQVRPLLPGNAGCFAL